MHAVAAEILKLRRSLVWSVVTLLPITLVLAGTATTFSSGGDLADGWHTLWLRSVVFYGLFPLQIGIAILASLVWRPEHRGSSWNALMSGPTSSLHLIIAKTVVISGLAMSMQLVMLGAILALGTAAFGLPGAIPVQYLGISLLIMAASVPVAALQSALSMLLRSFAAPVAVALAATGASVIALMAVGDLATVLPHALLARATQLGTGTFADTGSVDAPVTALVSGLAVAVSGIVVLASTALLDRQDVRA